MLYILNVRMMASEHYRHCFMYTVRSIVSKINNLNLVLFGQSMKFILMVKNEDIGRYQFKYLKISSGYEEH